MKHQWLVLLLCGGGLFNLAPLEGQDNETGGGALTSPSPATINFQVISQTKVDLGNRSVIYNLVVPPVLPPLPTPPPAAPLTPDQIQALQQHQTPPKKTVFVSLFATVFDRSVTLLQWSDENGAHRAYSNVDFNYFTGVGVVETTDTSYLLLITTVNDTRIAAAARNVTVPPASSFDVTQAQYMIVQDGSTAPTADSLKELDDLHTYFGANRQALIDGYNQRVAAQLALQQQLQANPPVPQDTVVNFWPVKNSVYLPATTGGSNP